MINLLQQRRQEPPRNSPHYGLSPEHLGDPQTLACRSPRIAIRDLTNATNTRTILAALIPPGRVLTQHAAFALACETTTAADEAFMLGVLCSMPCDWQARRRVELHMGNQEILGGLSIPDFADGPIERRVVEIAGRLAAVDERYSDWAQKVGVPVGSVTFDEREELLAELDACVAVLYGLDSDEVAVLYDTFARSRQWDLRRDVVLGHWWRINGDQS